MSRHQHRSYLSAANRVCLCLLLIAPTQTLPASGQVVGILMAQANRSYTSGNFEAALQYWSEAGVRYREQNDALGESRALSGMAAASLAQGKNRAGIEHLEKARILAEQTGNRRWLGDIINQLCTARLLLPDPDETQSLLEDALQLARQENDVELQALVYNNMGRLDSIQGRNNEALTAYDYGIRLANQSGNTLIVAQTAVNAGELALNTGRFSVAHTRLEHAADSARKLPDSHDKAFTLIRIAELQRALATHLPRQDTTLRKSAYLDLQDAAAVAKRIDDRRAESFAWGYLGELYEQQDSYQDALYLTDRAIFAIQQIHAPEVLYRWEWQKGRLLRVLGRTQDAIKAYRNAMHTLHSVRSELAASLEAAQESYHQVVGPLFLEYADLLLLQGESLHDPAQIQANLIEARDTVELIKSVELQDYFQDDCVAIARANVKGLEESLSASTAAIYPILFPDRTELLLSTSEGITRYTIPVTAEEMTRTIREFRRTLEKRTTRLYMRPARRLYDWLIRPIDEELETRNVDTLVIVPDAALRTIPMAALHDGREFLIQKYALVSTPSLELTDPRPLTREGASILINALTVPVQGFPELSFVPLELEEIQHIYGGKILQDKDFIKPQLEDQLTSHQYTIVHFASHGKFEGSVRESFILTYDGKLSMDELEQVISPSRYRRERPIELLTLSACQTAVGDDWAALGLAGVAIKAGARSALATLWYINDQATANLVTEFYRQLNRPGMSKAKALQQAQLVMLEDLRYQHPAYWAPFLLIGNWL